MIENPTISDFNPSSELMADCNSKSNGFRIRHVILFLMTLLLPLQAQNPPNVTSGVVDIGSTGTWPVFSLVRHLDRLYLINGAQGKSASARYYDLSTNSFLTDGNIPLEEPYGGIVKQGDLLWYGEDGTGPGGSLLHVRRHDGWKSYRPPTDAGEHGQSQWIYDGRIFLADYYTSYPGAATSFNAGSSYVSKRLIGQNGFKATIDGTTPTACFVDNFFEYKGNLFCTTLATQLTTTVSSVNGENFISRYTGDMEKPWELTYDRLSQLGFLGRPSAFGEINTTTRTYRAHWTPFKDHLFMDWYGVLNRYSSRTVTSKFDPGTTYERPANPVIAGNNLTIDGINSLPGGGSRYFSLIARNGYLYVVDSPPGQRIIRRTSDGVNFTTLCSINTASGSPLATLDNKTLFIEIAGEDIYFAADTRLYKIPGALLGANKPSGLANTAPAATDDTFSLTAGFSSVKEAMLGPLRNDSDADTDAFYASLVTPPSHGAVFMRYNGTFEYSAFGGFPGTDSFTYRINDGYGEGTATVTVTGAGLPANSSFTSTKINFQSGSTPLSGWLLDNGAVRAARNNLYYGWDTAQSGLNRTANPDIVLNTFMQMGAASRWQISVPNGTYQVKAYLGDAAAVTTGMTLNVEGENYLSNAGAPANQFFTITSVVTVSDGWLTVDNGSSAASATKLNALEITKRSSVLSAPSGFSSTTVSSSKIDLAWTDTTTSETGFQIERKVGNETTWTLLSTPGANATSYTQAGLLPSTSYSYRIRAIDAESVSPWSPTTAAFTSPLPLHPNDAVFNPALRWTFDETSGVTAASTGSVNLPVTLVGTPLLNSPGQLGGALQFNGTSQFGKVSDDTQLDSVNQFSISVWVRPGNLTGDAQFIASKRASSSSQVAYSVFFYTGDKLFVDIDGIGNRFSSNTIFTNNQWYHIAVVFDGTLATAERTKIYVNGALDVSGSESSSTLPNSTADLFIAQGDATSTSRFNGLMDDLRLYRAPLDSNQVATLFDKTPHISAPSITAHPSSQTLATGQTATFRVEATGYPSPDYQWHVNGIPISGATRSAHTTPPALATDHGAIYSVVVSNIGNEITSNEAVLLLHSPTLAQWRSSHFDAMQLADPTKEDSLWGDLADPDGDNLSNLLEYATDSMPLRNSTPSPVTLNTNITQLSLSFTRLNPSTLRYQIEASGDLITTNWSPIATLNANSSTWTGPATVSETGTGPIRQVTVLDIPPILEKKNDFCD